MAAFIDEGPPSPRHRHRERGPQNIDYEAFLKRHASTTHLLDIHLMRMNLIQGLLDYHLWSDPSTCSKISLNILQVCEALNMPCIQFLKSYAIVEYNPGPRPTPASRADRRLDIDGV